MAKSLKANKNQYVNNILLWDAKERNEKYYYKRFGKCTPQICQAACCRFNVIGHIDKLKKNQYNEMSCLQHVSGVQKRSDEKYDFYLTSHLCPFLTFDGKCQLHNKKNQPRVCTYFPMGKFDGVYLALRKICGYKFKKVKNPFYKKKQKR